MPSLRTDIPPAEALRRLARQTLAGLSHDLDAAKAGGGVHAARKKLKIARSLLRLLRHAMGKADFKAADSRLGKAARLLAGLRHAEAMREAVAKLSAAETEHSFDDISHMAEAGHRDAAHRSETAADIAEARGHVEAVRDTVNNWRLPKRSTRTFADAAAASYRHARRLMRRGLSSGDVATLHEARKSLIHHLHQLEILSPKMAEDTRSRIRGFSRLREDLGDLNDLAELKRQLKPGESGPDDRSGIAAAISRQNRKLLRRIEKRSCRLFSGKPRDLRRAYRAMLKT
jgi:CHAD domain-containing protein